MRFVLMMVLDRNASNVEEFDVCARNMICV